MLKNIFRQPLLHFLVLGFLLFALYGWVSSGDIGDKRVVIDDAALLEFMQYRQRAFSGSASEVLDKLQPAEYQKLVNDLVREEVLYREALRMGLDQNDYIIRRRLVQKMEYLARGFGLQNSDLDDAEIEAYYQANLARYYEAPTFTFTHVFINGNDAAARERALSILDELNSKGVEFAEGLSYGDRFIYHSHYVERDSDFIASHFGERFSGELASLDVNASRWTGPMASDHGLHLVMLAAKQEGGTPELAVIRGRVLRDALQDKLDKQAAAFVDSIVAGYEVALPERASAGSTDSL